MFLMLVLKGVVTTMSKSILFASGRMTPPFFWGGAEKSNLTLGLKLASRKIKVDYFGCFVHYYKETSFLPEYMQELGRMGIKYAFTNGLFQYKFQGFNCCMTDKDRFLDDFSNFLKCNKFDLVVTMLENSPEIIQICNENNIPVVLFVMDAFPVGVAPLSFANNVNGVVFSSKFLYKKLTANIDDRSVVFPPMFEPTWYISDPRESKYITFINPIKEKGVDIFIEIAQRLPDREFLVVDAWRKVELDFPPNVLHLQKQEDMRIIYGQTILLLVPSICEEAYGRVIVEAGLNGIPTVASDIGGIPEAVHSGGLLVKNYFDVKEWVSAIQNILLKKNYVNYSKLALESSRKNTYDWTDEFIRRYLSSKN